MTSCDICNSFQGTGRQRAKDEVPININRRHSRDRIPWSEFQLSAESCYFCSILLSGCRGTFGQHSIDEGKIEAMLVSFFYQNTSIEEEEEDIDKLMSFKMEDGSHFDVEMFITEDSPVPTSWEDMPVSHRTSRRTGCSESIEKLESWIQTCEEDDEHQDCRGPSDPNLPKRVIDVTDVHGGVQLYQSHGESARYICLSHCWGKSQIIITTKGTLKDRQERIDLGDLPKTFRDAVLLTRQLGIRYIWIDSLCILQDDHDDWAIESAQMATIYSNSYLTIAATHSRDGRGGLYVDTPDFEVAGLTPEGERYHLFFREMIDHHLESSSASDGSELSLGFISHGTIARHPLLTRAWVYQERLLSPRVVHFGPYELFFECLSTVSCECGNIQFHGSSKAAPVALMKLQYAQALYSFAEGVEWHIYAAYYMARVWRTMVCSYTALGITKHSDRLPAIGGLARKLGTTRKEKYVAGLWENTLNDDLLWIVMRQEGDKKPRASSMKAPTWSWASVETHVWYWDVLQHWNSDEVLTDEERLPYQHFCKVENWDIQNAGVDEFGHVEKGLIKITGLIAEGEIERVVKEDPSSSACFVRFSPTLRLKINPDYLFEHDGPHQVLTGTRVTCLRMSTIQEGLTDYLFSLVLKAVGENDEFERIGGLLVKSRPPPVDPLGGIFKDGDESSVLIR